MSKGTMIFHFLENEKLQTPEVIQVFGVLVNDTCSCYHPMLGVQRSLVSSSLAGIGK